MVKWWVEMLRRGAPSPAQLRGGGRWAAASILHLAIAKQDVHGLDLGVAQQLVDAFLAADAAVLEAAKGRAVEMARGAVDPDIA